MKTGVYFGVMCFVRFSWETRFSRVASELALRCPADTGLGLVRGSAGGAGCGLYCIAPASRGWRKVCRPSSIKSRRNKQTHRQSRLPARSRLVESFAAFSPRGVHSATRGPWVKFAFFVLFSGHASDPGTSEVGFFSFFNVFFLFFFL